MQIVSTMVQLLWSFSTSQACHWDPLHWRPKSRLEGTTITPMYKIKVSTKIIFEFLIFWTIDQWRRKQCRDDGNAEKVQKWCENDPNRFENDLKRFENRSKAFRKLYDFGWAHCFGLLKFWDWYGNWYLNFAPECAIRSAKHKRLAVSQVAAHHVAIL